MPPDSPGADAAAAAADVGQAAGGDDGARGAAESDAVEFRPAVSHVLSALARAVQAFHTYPAESPARDDVIHAVSRALAEYSKLESGPLRLDVTADGFSWRELTVGGDPGPERALLLALRKGYVSSVELDLDATGRDLREFAELLAFPDAMLARSESVAEILECRGVETVRLHVIPMHQAIEVGSIPAHAIQHIVEARRSSGGAEMQAEGGWIRVDPGVGLTRIGLEELASVLPDGQSLGVALQQMAGKRKEDIVPSAALLAHFGEIVELYEAADPGLVDSLFQRLATEVERLPEEARQQLLKDEILPGLVDGQAGGRILSHFSEGELNDALWMLLDIGTGGVDMLMAGLSKLQLPESRRALVGKRIAERIEPGATSSDGLPESAKAQRLDRILSVAGNPESELEVLRAFDLAISVDDHAAFEALETSLGETDAHYEQLKVHADLLRLSADSSVVESLLRRTRQLLFDLESRGGGTFLAHWIGYLARIAEGRDSSDPHIAQAIRSMLADHVTPVFIHRVALSESEDAGEDALVTIICAMGSLGVGAFVESLAVEQDRSARNRLLRALQPRAAEIAADLAEYLGHPEWYVVRNVLRLLGHGGPGFEDRVAECIDHDNPRVVREVLVALARIGTPEAVARVEEALLHTSPVVRREAVEAVWRFDSETAHELALKALGSDVLVASDPSLLQDLAEAAARRQIRGLRELLRALRWNALHPFSPDRRRLGRKAAGLLRSLAE